MKIKLKDGSEIDVDFSQNQEAYDQIVATIQPTLEAEYQERTTNAIKEAVSKEKTKLYGKINSTGEKNNELMATIKERDTTIADLQAKIVTLKTASPNPGEGDRGSATPTTPAQPDSEAIAKIVADAVEKAVSPLKSQLETQKREKVENYRRTLLAQNKGKLIEEMVVGETEEELDASVDKALQAFAKYANPTPPNPTPPTPTPTHTPDLNLKIKNPELVSENNPLGLTPEELAREKEHEKDFARRQNQGFFKEGASTLSPGSSHSMGKFNMNVVNDGPTAAQKSGFFDSDPNARKVDNVKSMSVKDFAANREKMMAEMEAESRNR